MDAVRVLMSKLETEPSIARSHPQRFFLFPSITQVLTLVELISNNSTSNHRGLTRNIHVYVVRLNCSVRAWYLAHDMRHEKIVRHCLILIESSNKFFD